MKSKLKVVDNLIASVRTNLPEGYNFNFFITQQDQLGVRGVWFLHVDKEIRKALKKEPANETLSLSETKLKTRRRKKA